MGEVIPVLISPETPTAHVERVFAAVRAAPRGETHAVVAVYDPVIVDLDAPIPPTAPEPTRYVARRERWVRDGRAFDVWVVSPPQEAGR